MGPKVDTSEKLDNAMGVLPVSIKENGKGIVKLPQENLEVCGTSYEDHAFLDNPIITGTLEEELMYLYTKYSEDYVLYEEVDCEQDMVFNGCKDDVDIVENVVHNEEKMVEEESLEATESSSSFGCSENSGKGSTTWVGNDVEVESQKWDENPWLSLSFELDEFRDLFGTRKKVSSHWREFIRPLMWRCKWTELQIRKLHFQASTYDKKLAEYDQRKQYELDQCTYGNLAVKTLPSVHQNQSGKIMKRKKRKRVEETMDLASYSSCHSLFSYYDSKRDSDDSAYLDDEHGNTEKTCNGERLFLEYKESDPFEEILRKIQEIQTHVNQLKTRLNEVVRETSERYIPIVSGFGPSQPLASAGPSSNLANVNDENYRTDSLVNDFGDNDKNETEIMEEVKPEFLEHLSDPNSSMRTSTSLGQPAVKLQSELNITPMNKRKRGDRKTRARKWSL